MQFAFTESLGAGDTQELLLPEGLMRATLDKKTRTHMLSSSIGPA